MKMNLSVVMGMIDKISAPMKKIISRQDHFSKKIKETQKVLKDKTSSLALIEEYQKMGKQAGKTGDQLKAAEERLEKINDKMKAAKQPSQSLVLQFKNQKEKVRKLSDIQKAYTRELSKTIHKMKDAGINAKRLKSEKSRLNREYDQSINKLNKLEKRYTTLKKIASSVTKTHGFIKPPNASQIKASAMAFTGLGASVFGYISTINKAAFEMENFRKVSSDLNMSLEDFQVIRFQADQINIDTDTVADAFYDMTEKLGELQAFDSGALADWYKENKDRSAYMEIKNAKDTTAAYKILLKQLSLLETKQEKMFFANEAFGDAGKQMLSMMEKGMDGLNNAREEYNNLGGAIKDKDAQMAQNYTLQLKKIKHAFESLKFAALAPVMKELTDYFREFTEQLKDNEKRAKILKQVKEVIKGIFEGIRSLGKGVIFVAKHLPELIAGVVAFKAVMFTLNAVLLANPLGMIIGLMALLATVSAYLIHKFEGISPLLEASLELFKSASKAIIEMMDQMAQSISNLLSPAIENLFTAFQRTWSTVIEMMDEIIQIILNLLGPAFDDLFTELKRIWSSIAGIFGEMIRLTLLLPRAIMKMVSMIPDKLLPDGWGQSIKTAQKNLETLDAEFAEFNNTAINYALNGEVATNLKPLQQQIKLTRAEAPVLDLAAEHKAQTLQAETTSIIRSPTVESKAQVDLRIKSDKPVEITSVKSDRNTDIGVDAGNLLDLGY